jgi:hypothetical protein
MLEDGQAWFQEETFLEPWFRSSHALFHLGIFAESKMVLTAEMFHPSFGMGNANLPW